MLTFLYVLQVIVSLLLIVVVIFQKSEGGASLVSSNSYNSFFANKTLTSNPLTKITIILGLVFFFNSIAIGGIQIAKVNNKSSIADKIEEISQDKANEQNQKSSTTNK
jgi:preprotein translocase subunit SecG